MPALARGYVERVYAWPPQPDDTEAVAQIPGSQQAWSVGAGLDGGNIDLYTG